MKTKVKRTVGRIFTAAVAAAMIIPLAQSSAQARTIVLSGDYDSDGVITSSDALAVLRESVGTGNIRNSVRSRSDVDNDGDITSSDAIAILRDSVGSHKIEQSRSADDPYTVNDGLNDFSANLFRETYTQGENTLVSPLSVYTALAMLENGAAGQTQTEMLGMLGGGSNTLDTINRYMNGYISTLRGSDYLNTANAMFVMQRPDIEIGQDFVTEIQKDYFAEVFNEPANNETVDKINDWVKLNTKDMIDSIVPHGGLDDNSVAMLLNAVSFKANWADQYEDYQIKQKAFNNYDGSAVMTDFLWDEEYQYISDELSEGFIKNYNTWNRGSDGQWENNEKYSFVAILPNRGVTVDEYIAQMNDSTIRQLVHSKEYMAVNTFLPKFKYECTFKLNDTLKALGMQSAFNPDFADFSPLAVSKLGNRVYLNSVTHKTFIELDESGTKAAAVTAIDVVTDSEPELPTKSITLDRPFIYVIYDMNNDVPAFIGTVCSLDGELVDKDAETDSDIPYYDTDLPL